jgi:hypothetical protein
MAKFPTTYAISAITTNVVSLNPVHGEVFLIHYMIKFVSDLRQVGGFLQILLFLPPIKTESHDISEILLRVALSTINQPTLKIK